METKTEIKDYPPYLDYPRGSSATIAPEQSHVERLKMITAQMGAEILSDRQLLEEIYIMLKTRLYG